VIDEETAAEIKAFVAERDAVLIEGDLDKLRAFHQKHNPGLVLPAPDVFECSFHKARTGAKSLPLEVRKISKAWLTQRGFSSMDDGDL
jgi:hypothetical protein